MKCHRYAVACGCAAACGLVSLFFLKSDASHSEETKPAPAASLSPASPEEAVAQLAAAKKAGDLDRIASLYAEPWGASHRRILEAIRAAGQAEQAIIAAMNARFGASKDGESLPRARRLEGMIDSMRTKEQRLVAMRIVDKQAQGDGYLLTVSASERLGRGGPDAAEARTVLFAAVREDETWKLKPHLIQGSMEDEAKRAVKRAGETTAEMADLAGAYQRIAADISGGKIGSPAEVYRVIERAIARHMSASYVESQKRADDAAATAARKQIDRPVGASKLLEELTDLPKLPEEGPSANDIRRHLLEEATESYRRRTERGLAEESEAETVKRRVKEVSALIASATPAASNHVLAPLVPVGAHLNKALAAFLAGRSAAEAFAPWKVPPKFDEARLRKELKEIGAASAKNFGFEYELIFRKSGKPVYYLRTHVLADGERAELIDFSGEAVRRDLYVSGRPLSEYAGQAAPFQEVAEGLLRLFKTGDLRSLPLADADALSRTARLPPDMAAAVTKQVVRMKHGLAATASALAALDYDEVHLRLDDQAALVRNERGEVVGMLRGTLGLTRDGSLGFVLERVRRPPPSQTGPKSAPATGRKTTD